MSGKINNEIEECIRNNVTWQNLPIHLKQVNKNEIKSIILSSQSMRFYWKCLIRENRVIN